MHAHSVDSHSPVRVSTPVTSVVDKVAGAPGLNSPGRTRRHAPVTYADLSAYPWCDLITTQTSYDVIKLLSCILLTTCPRPVEF